MIQDREMRALFGAESEEHLQRLDEGLLRLESAPDDSVTLGEVFRHAHSLKGAARMLGLREIETLAHGFEEALGGAARGQAPLSNQIIERLLGALDGMRGLVKSAINDQPAEIDVSALLAKLNVSNTTKSAEPIASTPSAPEPSAPPKKEVIKSEASPFIPQVSASKKPPTEIAWSIETMRVEPAKLDALLSMAGELVVSATRAHRAQNEVVELSELRDGWQRAASASKRTLREISGEEPQTETEARLIRELERLSKAESERLERLEHIVERLSVAGGDLNRLANVVGEMEAAIRGVRLLPLSTLFGLFPRSVRDLGRASGKAVHLSVEGSETFADKRILEALKDPLMHLIRNAIDHGIETPAERVQSGKSETATLQLRGFQTAHQIVVEVEDDGRGLDESAIRASALRKGLKTEAELAALSSREALELVFAPGFSTRREVSELSGRGVGLDIVRANVARLRGSVDVESQAGKGCLFRLSLPVTLATTRVLLVRAGGQTFGVPIDAVRGLFRALPDEVFRFAGRDTVLWNGLPVNAMRLAEVLGLPSREVGALPCVILEAGEERVGLLLDALLEEQEIILKPVGVLADRVRHLAGATILDSGEVCLILHPGELLRVAMRANSGAKIPVAPDMPPPPKCVLLVEDSITVRTQEKRILESAGYEVTIAVDGLDGWNQLQNQDFDAVISDIEMPHLDGLELATRIREDPKYAELPIILVSSLASDQDRKRGAQVGANAYIVKSAFDQKELIDALERFI